MKKVYNTSNCDEIKVSFELSNNMGFLPAYTSVFLDLQNGVNVRKQIFITPRHLTDASIPLTPSFKHNKGFLSFETYINYNTLKKTSTKEQIIANAKKLILKYTIQDCNGINQEFSSYDFGPVVIESKELIYFVALIDLI